MRILIILFLLSVPAFAADDCNFGTIRESRTPLFPPLAHAAHLTGVVVLVASFKTNGVVENIQVVSGPQMLWDAAKDYVGGWEAGPYSGPRSCPIALEYGYGDWYDSKVVAIRVDQQHVMVRGPAFVPLVGENADPPHDSFWGKVKGIFHRRHYFPE